MTNITIIKYNNYYNRLFKRPDLDTDGYNYLIQYTTGLSSLTDYSTYENINFFKGDYINAELVLNTSRDNCDYLIESEPVTGKVLSRWFVIENDTTRSGQSKFTLRRDVFVDYYEDYVDAPAYIEKATCNPNDIAIYNQEEITFNEIKQSEDKLTDFSKVSWIVGYFAPNAADLTDTVPIANINYSTQSNIPVNTTYKVINKCTTDIEIRVRNQSGWYIDFNTAGKAESIYQLKNLSLNFQYADKNNIKNFIQSNADTIQELFYDNTYKKKDTWSKLDGSYVYCTGNSTFYQISVTTSNTTETGYLANDNEITTSIRSLLLNAGLGIQEESGNAQYVKKNLSLTNVTVTYTAVSDLAQLSYTISQNTNKLSDAPYKIFAIPYTSVRFKYTDDQQVEHTVKTLTNPITLNLATAIATKLGTGTGGSLYDLQLVPYCPFQEVLTDIDHGWLELNGVEKGKDYEFITDNQSAVKGIILFPKQSTFTFDINREINLPTTAIERKIEGQCNKYRLCSPNYSAMFDFNLLKTGSITKFNVDCTYKPYSPYIHINPNWLGLYGQDFNDARGLILQGDFSLPIITEQWQQYQINNKNYLNSFNRQIDSVELNNKYAKQQDIFNAISGTIGGATSGAVGGSKFKAGGAAIGAAVGGLTSAAAGIYDVSVNEKLRNDALDLTKDQFNYNLQNIQALPNTLAKVSSFDANNKLVPILEYYSCKDEEKQIFRDKLTYNGMTINRIGTINEFLQSERTYIKGQFIRLENVHDDYHAAKALAEEFYKGVYI